MFADRTEVAWSVLNEGVGYFVTTYTSAEEMPDDELKAAFIATRQAVNRFLDMLPEVEGF